MGILDEFEELAIISHVINLINNHMSLQDITLAEFLIDLCKNVTCLEQYQETLNSKEIELPHDLAKSIYNFLHRKKEKNSISKRDPVFSSLSIPDQLPFELEIKQVPLRRERWNQFENPQERKERGNNTARCSSSKTNNYLDNEKTFARYSQHCDQIGNHTSQSNVLNKPRINRPNDQWEIKQLIASGALNASTSENACGDFASNSKNDNSSPEIDSYLHSESKSREFAFQEDRFSETDFQIELNKTEPLFLKGQTKVSIDLSPIRIIKNPQGSLNRAAMNGSNLLKSKNESKKETGEVKETKEMKDSATFSNDSIPVHSILKSNDLNTQDDKLKNSLIFNKSKNKNFDAKTSPSNQNESKDFSSVHLPVEDYKIQILQAVCENQVLILVGETGSGKTTKIPQYLAEAGYTSVSRKCQDNSRENQKLSSKCIACTQPRRVAATSVAKRVAQEVGCRLGDEVGYTIRFDDCTSSRTCIKYMTDGMLLRECLSDPLLSSYSVVVLDEAHERTLNTDILFGLIKKTLLLRHDLRLIVTSATLECDKFSAFFSGAPVFRIPGRTFPVEILYTKDPEQDYLYAAIQTVLQIHRNEPQGDVLVFLTGQEEIETACATLASSNSDQTMSILPVYATMPSDQQAKIFSPTPQGTRKIVVGTNVAETSITIDGIFYVVDPGFVKQKIYNPRLGMDSLVITPISQSQAKQRSGRAGRTGPGKCYRLYTEKAYLEEMLPNSAPEIQRTSLTNSLLQLKAMGINDLLQFDFMDRPPLQALISALQELFNLGALDEDGLLTASGRQMALFPLEPALAKILIQSTREGCVSSILSIVAMLSTQLSPFYRPRDKQEEADRAKAKFHSSHGDHLTLLSVYDKWIESKCNQQWAFDHYLQARVLRRADEIRRQLSEIVRTMQGKDYFEHNLVTGSSDLSRAIRRSIVSGCFMHVAHKDSTDGGYRTIADRTSVYIHPSSALFGGGGGNDWVVYHELVCTSREWMREVTVIDPKWLTELAPGYFTVGNSSSNSGNAKLKPIGGGDDWRLSKRRVVTVSQRF